jgi:sialic acid synthase SpsE
MRKLYFIAELGQNHQGDIKIAKEMIDKLIGSGINAVKTAKRDIDICLTEEQKKLPYTGKHSFGKNYYEHRKALELSFEDFAELKNYAESLGFDFISSFTDIPSFEFLKNLGLDKLKIASQRITDKKLLEHVSRNFDGTMYLSSGMSEIEHIDYMVYLFKNNKKYLMQCTSVYPCQERLLNIRVLKKYRTRYKSLVDGFGFSSHNMSIGPDIAAYTLGANIIERHFTLDRTMKGGDHVGSLEIHEIKNLISLLEDAAKALGSSDKHILEEEIPAMRKLRGDLE